MVVQSYHVLFIIFHLYITSMQQPKERKETMKKFINILKDWAGLFTVLAMIAALAAFVAWSTKINDERVSLVETLEAARLEGKERITVVYGGKKYVVDVDKDDVRKSTFIKQKENEK